MYNKDEIYIVRLKNTIRTLHMTDAYPARPQKINREVEKNLLLVGYCSSIFPKYC